MVFRQRAANQDIIQGADRSIVALIKEENATDIMQLTQRLVKPYSTIYTDENPAYDNLNAYYNLERVNHSQEYCSIDGITNEMAWREDNRRKSVGEKLENLLQSCMQTPPLRDFINYYQGNKKGKEKYGLESLGITANDGQYHFVA